ncbi:MULTISPECIES: glutamate decarboxylase [Synechococcaceae]|uniref:glutamate decarboxylase n=1 Tax=Synechococcaceae TaxID=1890426 RepID=UPI001F3E4155|nr:MULTISPECIES: glutamate decarboxylase [Synechococcaceae]MCT4363539.1 glutamate decarboxylase [Candidatus Regnicoccus frigidus MAG-AL1]MCT4366413.1 glutamate decarboxylase [Candidatus Regnicoccus frigidus MAG-AL2]
MTTLQDKTMQHKTVQDKTVPNQTVQDNVAFQPDSEDEVYGSSDFSLGLPKADFPHRQSDPRHVYEALHDELMLDGNSRQNLATFCQTWVEPEIHQLMDECIDKNMVDKDEYPQTAEIERRCLLMLADLWNAPRVTDSIGSSTSGSSEAAMLGGMAMKRRWEASRKQLGKSTEKPNLITGPVQVCWHKFARYWDVELREIPMQEGRLIMTEAEVIARCDENTIGVVPTLGVTFTGEYEPVEAVSIALDAYQAKTGLDIPIHVDAASGGFLAPFCSPDLLWDFRLPRVRSINASGHKFGLAPLGAGWILWRTAEDLPEQMVFWVNYLGGNMRDIALNFSRPGGQVICQYYNFLRLGMEGYRKIHMACYETAQYLATEISKLGPFEMIYGGAPDYGIPALCWRMKPGIEPGFSLFSLADRLRVRGWQVPAYLLPAHCEELPVQRILVRHGVSRDLATMLLDDIRQALEFLGRHPEQRPISGDEAGGFHH